MVEAMKPKTMPPVIERRPRDSAEVRRVIRAAERGERLWREGDEGIVTPLPTREQGIELAVKRMRDEGAAMRCLGIRIALPGGD